MLGWYGLQDGGGAGGQGGGAGGGTGPPANLKLLATSRGERERGGGENEEDHKPPSVSAPNDGVSGSLPYTNGWDSRALHAIDCKKTLSFQFKLFTLEI